MAAKYSTALGEVLESMNDIPGSIEKHLKAGDIYAAEDSSSSCSKALLKSASLYAKLCKWNEAIQLFDRVIESSLKSRCVSIGQLGFLCIPCLQQVAILLREGIHVQVAAVPDPAGQVRSGAQDRHIHPPESQLPRHSGTEADL